MLWKFSRESDGKFVFCFEFIRFLVKVEIFLGRVMGNEFSFFFRSLFLGKEENFLRKMMRNRLSFYFLLVIIVCLV